MPHPQPIHHTPTQQSPADRLTSRISSSFIGELMSSEVRLWVGPARIGEERGCIPGEAWSVWEQSPGNRNGEKVPPTSGEVGHYTHTDV